MKKTLIMLISVLTLVACSTDEEQTNTTQETQLRIDIDKCVDEQINNKQNKNIPPPPGLLCECIQEAIEKNK